MTRFAMCDDASRSAVAALRSLRNGDEESALLLVNGLDRAEEGLFAGACLAIASAALQVCDQLAEQVALSSGKEVASADDILRLLLLGQYAMTADDDNNGLGSWDD